MNLLLPRRNPHVMPGEWEQVAAWARDAQAQDLGLIAAWEEAVAAMTGMPHAAAVSSGRTGMALILRHLGVAEGDEVVVPAYTLKDLLPLIQGFGATVIPADIDPDTLNVTAESVAARLTPRTRAVIVLHAFGAPAPMPEILAVTDAARVPVIEDGAHALGASLGGRAAGSFGYAAFFSFETTKPVNTYGGGMVVSRDAALIDMIHEQEAAKPFGLDTVMHRIQATQQEARLMQTGLAFPLLLLLSRRTTQPMMSAVYRHMQHLPPSSVRYSPVQARLGLEKLKGLPDRIRHRRELAQFYAAHLPEGCHVQRLLDGAASTWYFCVALLPRDAWDIRARLLLRGVDAGVRDEVSDNCAALLGYDDCPNMADAFKRTLALPIFDSCAEAQARRVVDVLARLMA